MKTVDGVATILIVPSVGAVSGVLSQPTTSAAASNAAARRAGMLRSSGMTFPLEAGAPERAPCSRSCPVIAHPHQSPYGEPFSEIPGAPLRTSAIPGSVEMSWSEISA